MSNANDLVSAYILNQIARDTGSDTRPGKRVTVRIDARCNLAEVGQFIRAGVGTYEVHVDDLKTLEALKEDYVTASVMWMRTPPKPAQGCPAEEGAVVKRDLTSRQFTTADVVAHQERMNVTRAREPGSPGPASFEEAFYDFAARSMKPIVSYEVVESLEAALEAPALEAPKRKN